LFGQVTDATTPTSNKLPFFSEFFVTISGEGRTMIFRLNGRLGSLPDWQSTADTTTVVEVAGRTESSESCSVEAALLL
jgi:hypothetical protein